MHFLVSDKSNLYVSEAYDSNHDQSSIELKVYDRHSLLENNYQYSSLDRSSFLSLREGNNIIESSFTNKRFLADYLRIKKEIAEGRLEKGVAFNTLKLSFKHNIKINNFLGIDPQSIKRNSLYGLWNHERGIIGLSPELLLRRDDDCYIIDALAATATTEEGLDQSKLVEEHQTVIKGLLEKLSASQIDFNLGEKVKIKFNHYYHWYQQIRIDSNYPVDELIKYLAPTAAISGYPHQQFEQLSDTQAFEKDQSYKVYAGCFHFRHLEFEKVIIGIRNIQWFGKDAYIHAGCGINKNSTFEEELKESHLKAVSTLRYFGYELN